MSLNPTRAPGHIRETTLLERVFEQGLIGASRRGLRERSSAPTQRNSKRCSDSLPMKANNGPAVRTTNAGLPSRRGATLLLFGALARAELLRLPPWEWRKRDRANFNGPGRECGVSRHATRLGSGRPPALSTLSGRPGSSKADARATGKRCSGPGLRVIA